MALWSNLVDDLVTFRIKYPSNDILYFKSNTPKISKEYLAHQPFQPW